MQDELALAVHMDVDRGCLRVNTETVVPVLLADSVCHHPLEIVFAETRERQGDHDRIPRVTEDGEVGNLLLCVHFGLLLSSCSFEHCALGYLHNSMYYALCQQSKNRAKTLIPCHTSFPYPYSGFVIYSLL